MRQPMEGKLCSDQDREPSNVQIVIKECSLVDVTLALIEKHEQFLATSPHMKPGDEEREAVMEKNALKDVLGKVQAGLAQEQETVPNHQAELPKCKECEHDGLVEVEGLKLLLEEQSKENKGM